MSAQRAARALTTITGAEWRVAGAHESAVGQPVCDGKYEPGSKEYDAMMKLFPTAAKIAVAVTPDGRSQFVAQDYDVGELEVRASRIHHP
jgi:hypothetical protein